MKEQYFVYFYKDDLFLQYESLKEVAKAVENEENKYGKTRGQICIVKGRELEIETSPAKVTIKE